MCGKSSLKPSSAVTGTRVSCTSLMHTRTYVARTLALDRTLNSLLNTRATLMIHHSMHLLARDLCPESLHCDDNQVTSA